jgi:anti-anti-sigma regulatory factor
MGIRQFTIIQDAEGIFRVKGELTILDIEYLKEFLDTTLGREKKIFFDMAEVTYADTASLQLLIAFRRNLKPDIEWQVLELSPELDMIVTVSGLKTFLVE